MLKLMACGHGSPAMRISIGSSQLGNGIAKVGIGDSLSPAQDGGFGGVLRSLDDHGGGRPGQ